MINNLTPISMAEAKEFMDKESETLAFVKKFSKMKPEKAKEMRKKLEDLGLVKMNEVQITKIIDIMPEKSEEINKIFTEIGLDEDETKKILDIVNEYK